MDIRFADVRDAATVTEWIRKLGNYQMMGDAVTVEVHDIELLLTEQRAKAIIGYEGCRVVAMAYFFDISYSFTGINALYIDAMIVDENARNAGAGAEMFRFLADYALKNGYKRLQWACLDWNEIGINFYDKIGATRFDNLIVYRMDTLQLEKLLLPLE